MRCKAYIFELTSGRLAEAGKLDRAKAFQHLLICRSCRRFTRNDEMLTNIFKNYREKRL